MCNALQYCTAVRRWFIIINKLKKFYFFCTKNLKIYFTFTRKSCAQKVLLTNFKRQFQLKETVSVISSDSLCSHVNARFTTALLKASSDQL